ncbi:JAB domain-containing protein [Ethanoligenens harbinense]|uniref:DNA repair protein RadC n=1 Tax=Ethanoligenens harbinense (strain DSM 18485 / JCM 12961 / CGMCC 1.5033 / YUAN-3) TaxID=663278 RepID=E6U843_ETHHY|nr:DNA repair protein RadC [Ethanoligenens harbinense]ADU27062.1 DNA repair protein RadC [Ethanoligenens harbinense YUAN-3]AVQ96142.1 hypothetical protein CXQ68_07830 [Ethanoligenens harbinense YUAN-3]AYF38802.1 hypothetical protein CXP51_07700 [Ethanoligenens harbinense]AYF41552.1 hypothetical protein CN246_07845 [Ethanoligenens harbinense]QCN92383.1 DNA repair protein RadC [Ethanoligenens harbinense]
MKQKEGNAHEGHRERLKARFAAEGLDHFEPHVILEMILFYSLPRRDTNELSHRLLDAFGGSLSSVFDAPLEELQKVPGIGQNTAILLKLFPEVCRRYLMDLSDAGRIVRDSEDAAKYLLPFFMGRTAEIVALMCIDGKGKVLFCGQVFEGSVNAASVSVRRIVEIVVRYAATDVILAHNHPGGLAIPSEEDVHVTAQVADALRTVDIRLLDHLIIAGKDWVSLAATPTTGHLFAVRDGFAVF